MQQQTLTVKDIANYLGVHTDTIYSLVKENQIPHLKLGKRILFTKESVDVWMAEQVKQSMKSI